MRRWLGRVTSAGARHDDGGNRRMVGERTRDRAQQEVFEHTVPAGADHEEIGTDAGGAQHRSWVSRQHCHLDRRVSRHVLEHHRDAVFEFIARGVLGPSDVGTEGFTGNPFVGERPHDGHACGPTNVPERPTERVAGYSLKEAPAWNSPGKWMPLPWTRPGRSRSGSRG